MSKVHIITSHDEPHPYLVALRTALKKDDVDVSVFSYEDAAKEDNVAVSDCAFVVLDAKSNPEMAVKSAEFLGNRGVNIGVMLPAIYATAMTLQNRLLGCGVKGCVVVNGSDSPAVEALRLFVHSNLKNASELTKLWISDDNYFLPEERKIEGAGGARPIHLTKGEGQILRALLVARGHVLSKEDLHAHTANPDSTELKMVDVFICKLRKKLNAAGEPDAIDTVWGRGYVFPTRSELAGRRKEREGIKADPVSDPG